MSIFLHHKVTKKPLFPMLLYIIIFYNIRASLTFCPLRRLHNFNNDCNLVLLWTSNVRLTVPCGLAVRIWRSHRYGRVRFPAWEIFHYVLHFSSSSKNKRKTISLVYMSSNFVKFRAKIFLSSSAGNILTIFLI